MASDWAYLPKNLLDSVLERLLSSSDYLRFSIVCKPWFSVAKHNQSRHKKMLSHQEPPMLLFFNPKEDAWSLYNVLDNKILDHVNLKMPNKRFCGSCKGWLIVVGEDFSVTLINPFLRSKENKIHLPQLVSSEYSALEAWCDGEKEARTELCDSYVLKAIITADPITNSNECIVVMIDVGVSQIAFTRIGGDKWTFIDTECCTMAIDVLQFGDKLCALDANGELITFSITSDSYSVVSRFACSFPRLRYNFGEYLVQSHENELLLVLGLYKYVDGRFTFEFLVFKYDFDKCMWIEKISLGDDVAIFIGENISTYVVASNFPGCKANCIYPYDFGVYDMKTRKISKPYSTKLMTLLELNKMISQCRRPIWFTPTFYL